MIEHFLQLTRQKLSRPISGLTPEAFQALKTYHWPGNVRELQNVIERGAILCNNDYIDLDALPIGLTTPNNDSATTMPDSFSLRDAEQAQISRSLRQTGWNKSRAANLLGITRKTLDKKIRDFELCPTDDEPEL